MNVPIPDGALVAHCGHFTEGSEQREDHAAVLEMKTKLLFKGQEYQIDAILCCGACFTEAAGDYWRVPIRGVITWSNKTNV